MVGSRQCEQSKDARAGREGHQDRKPQCLAKGEMGKQRTCPRVTFPPPSTLLVLWFGPLTFHIAGHVVHTLP